MTATRLLPSARLDLTHFEREGEVLLRADVLEEMCSSTWPNPARLVRAADRARPWTRRGRGDGWEWVPAGGGYDRRRPRRPPGLLGRKDKSGRALRDWHDFEWLIGLAGRGAGRPARPDPQASGRRCRSPNCWRTPRRRRRPRSSVRGTRPAELEADVFEGTRLWPGQHAPPPPALARTLLLCSAQWALMMLPTSIARATVAAAGSRCSTCGHASRLTQGDADPDGPEQARRRRRRPDGTDVITVRTRWEP